MSSYCQWITSELCMQNDGFLITFVLKTEKDIWRHSQQHE